MSELLPQSVSIVRPIHQHAVLGDESLRLSANLYHAGTTIDRLVIISHGFNEDKTLQGTTPVYAAELVAAGISVLAYDFAGFGRSDPEIASLATGVADLKTVINYVKKELFCHSIGLFGHSFGSAVSLVCYSEDISAIATIGGVTGAMPFPMEKIFLPEQFMEFKKNGYAKEYRTYGTRPEILVNKNVLDQMQHLDQKSYFHVFIVRFYLFMVTQKLKK